LMGSPFGGKAKSAIQCYYPTAEMALWQPTQYQP